MRNNLLKLVDLSIFIDYTCVTFTFIQGGETCLKLSEWAKLNGINYKTAWTWFRKGLMPVEAKQMPSGMIIVYPDKPLEKEKAV